MKLTEFINKKDRINWYSALIATILFLNISILLSAGYYSLEKIYIIIYYLIAAISSFFVFYSNKANKIRLFLFSLVALLLVFSFIPTFYNIRGHIGIKAEDISEGVPFCHIAIMNNLLSLPILKTLVSPAKLFGPNATFYSMVIIWFWATILIGKGWCSWGCFYGGWDSFFSSIRKKPLIKVSTKTIQKLKFVPYAFLILIAVSSLFLFVPVFCSYLCPFKTITEFQQVTNLTSWIVFTISVGGFISFCILMPIFFKIRIWCTYLCPFGAFQGLVGKVFSIFKMKIDKEKCIECKACVSACKVNGITEESLSNKKFTLNCSLCTACLEKCPKKAIYVTAFYNKESFGPAVDKLTSRLSGIKIIKNIRSFLINVIDDILNPQTFLYFFALSVLFTFFASFYFDMIIELKKIIGG